MVTDLAAKRGAAASVARRQEATRRRDEILSLILGGVTFDAVAAKYGVSRQAIVNTVREAFDAQPSRPDLAATLRGIESARLDRAQLAIWPAVQAGDVKAVLAFLRLSERRAKMLGLDAPTQVNLSVNVRAEMESVLAELEGLVLGEVVRELPAASD